MIIRPLSFGVEMKPATAIVLRFFSFFLFAHLVIAEPFRITAFSPEGASSSVRQVRATFSQAMVAFGDPRSKEIPFEIQCPVSGQGRWADPQNWVYDFSRDITEVVNCSFTVRSDWRARDGALVGGKRTFSFSTDPCLDEGPSIVASLPNAGGAEIAEDGLLVFQPSCPVHPDTVLRGSWFEVDGVAERVGVDVVEGFEKYSRAQSNGYAMVFSDASTIMLRARQRFPEGSRVRFVWSKGIRNTKGRARSEDQLLTFTTRPAFRAAVRCGRMYADGRCDPYYPLYIGFTARVPPSVAQQATLVAADGTSWRGRQSYIWRHPDYDWFVEIRGPFPREQTLTLQVPDGLRSVDGRLLEPPREPIVVKTGDVSPLIQFPGPFGIVEQAHPILPLTVRRVRSELSPPESTASPATDGEEPLTVNVLRVAEARDMPAWLGRMRVTSQLPIDKRLSLIRSYADSPDHTRLTVKPTGTLNDFQVIGVPLPRPGLYIAEVESKPLASTLYTGVPTAYVSTAILVTDLAVHLKWGEESSLIWVTSLSLGQPVAGAVVRAYSCSGEVLWQGKTGSEGFVATDRLPARRLASSCGTGEPALMVTAEFDSDLGFVTSQWNEGIEPWRFGVSEWESEVGYSPERVVGRSVLARTLLHRGETVHLKHILRQRSVKGYLPTPEELLPTKVLIRHLGSDDQFELPFQPSGATAFTNEWQIPRHAKLGVYQVVLSGSAGELESGTFSVEDFRTPLMRASVSAPAEALVNPSTLPLDVHVQYLAGGGASRLPVKIRYQMQPREVSFPAFEGFQFAQEVPPSSESEESEELSQVVSATIPSLEAVLDEQGAQRVVIQRLPRVVRPQEMGVELEYKDPNGEIQTVAERLPLWPSARVVGVKTDGWANHRSDFRFAVAVADTLGAGLEGVPVTVKLWQREFYTHRERLVGGMFGYRNVDELREHGALCSGRTDSKGILTCNTPLQVAGNLLLEAIAVDADGSETRSVHEVWVGDGSEWWFPQGNTDRMDVLPERVRYEPGETARFQVRSPFREATALITVEREGIVEARVQPLSGHSPVVEVPIRPGFAPNVFVSVLAVRGRVDGFQPTAIADLGKPAYRLGIAEIRVGWKEHELKVRVRPEHERYQVRETSKVSIEVVTPSGAPVPHGEVAVAAVDEGLLELKDNDSWELLAAMMGRRPYSLSTFTAQMQVVGKRHFGLKALPHGGGGGKLLTRTLFDTLLYWNPRVALDASGRAQVEVPLNDSITQFRLVAVATSGNALFGTGYASIRAAKDIALYPGISPTAREGDTPRVELTVQNTTDHEEVLDVGGGIGLGHEFPPQQVVVAAGASARVGWSFTIPSDTQSLQYHFEARRAELIRDAVEISQQVLPAVPEQVYQASLLQLDKPTTLPVALPDGAIPGRGGVRVAFIPKLSDGGAGIRDYMRAYPFSCLEQRTSKSVALRDETLWKSVVDELPTYLDEQGFAKYFPSEGAGHDTLTAYVLSAIHAAGWTIPDSSREQMLNALAGFVEGRMTLRSYPWEDTTTTLIRRISAVQALSRYGRVTPQMLPLIASDLRTLPTSALIDLFLIWERQPESAERTAKRKLLENLFRTRLNFQGTVMTLSTERTDGLWWGMVSGDENAVRLALALVHEPAWKGDMPKLLRGSLERQRRGHWDLTTANVWGSLLLEQFGAVFEGEPLTGVASAVLAETTKSVDWGVVPSGLTETLPWPPAPSALTLNQIGSGKPWVIMQSVAALPLRAPLSSGYHLTRTIVPVEQRDPSRWQVGDIYRVEMTIEAQSDRSWVVVQDPVPSGGSILGSGLKRGRSLGEGADAETDFWEEASPVFVERLYEAYRAYFDYLPKGTTKLSYLVRLNTAGSYQLPPTRAEAMYAPEMFGELPNQLLEVADVVSAP